MGIHDNIKLLNLSNLLLHDLTQQEIRAITL